MFTTFSMHRALSKQGGKTYTLNWCKWEGHRNYRLAAPWRAFSFLPTLVRSPEAWPASLSPHLPRSLHQPSKLHRLRNVTVKNNPSILCAIYLADSSCLERCFPLKSMLSSIRPLWITGDDQKFNRIDFKCVSFTSSPNWSMKQEPVCASETNPEGHAEMYTVYTHRWSKTLWPPT